MAAEKCIATLRYKLNRRIDGLNRRLSNKGYYPETEEFRESVRHALALSSNTEEFLAFLNAREKLGLIDNVSAQKEFKAIVKLCHSVLFAKDDIFIEQVRVNNNSKPSHVMDWEEKVESSIVRESESRRTFRGCWLLRVPRGLIITFELGDA